MKNKFSYLVAVYPEGNSRYRAPKTRGVRFVDRVSHGIILLEVLANRESDIWKLIGFDRGTARASYEVLARDPYC